MKALIVILALCAAGCGSSPTAPSAPPVVVTPPAPRLTPTLPIVVSGQSNAGYLEPFLRAVYPLPVTCIAQNGHSIGAWSDHATPAVLWPALQSTLHQPLQAFVWWQGESDRTDAQYLDDLRDLIGRVRLDNGNPRLLVVEVRVLDLPINADVRAAQETFARTDPNAIIVSSDGFQLDTSDHLTDAGYRAVADRIIAALR